MLNSHHRPYAFTLTRHQRHVTTTGMWQRVQRWRETAGNVTRQPGRVRAGCAGPSGRYRWGGPLHTLRLWKRRNIIIFAPLRLPHCVCARTREKNSIQFGPRQTVRLCNTLLQPRPARRSVFRAVAGDSPSSAPSHDLTAVLPRPRPPQPLLLIRARERQCLRLWIHRDTVDFDSCPIDNDASSSLCMNVCTYMHTYISIHVHACMHACMHAYTNKRTHAQPFSIPDSIPAAPASFLSSNTTRRLWLLIAKGRAFSCRRYRSTITPSYPTR